MFTDRERLVFCFDYRGEKRYADPLAVQRLLLRRTAGEFHRLRSEAAEDVSAAPLPEGALPEMAAAHRAAAVMARLDAEEGLLDAVRHAFGLPAFDHATGDGATDAEALATLYAWEEWMEKNGGAAGN